MQPKNAKTSKDDPINQFIIGKGLAIENQLKRLQG